MDAAALKLRRLRVLVFVDHVFVDRQIHQPVDFVFCPGLAEGREVLSGVAVQIQLVVDQLENLACDLLRLREALDRSGMIQSR